MKINIGIKKGVSTIGNYSNANISLVADNTSDINSLKTIIDGKWTSWSKGAPESFQGFLELEKGMGFVVSADSDTGFVINGDVININDMNVKPGLNMLCLPFKDASLSTGYVPRMKIKSLKTLNNGSWGSWTFGAPDMFQGFTKTDPTSGYVCNIEDVFDTYLDSDIRDAGNGVRFTLSNTTLAHGESFSGVTFTDPDGVGSLNFDSVNYDKTTPTLIMFIAIDDSIAKIDFPVELDGKKFTIVTNEVTLSGKFSENENYRKPTIIDGKVDSDGLKISFDSIESINKNGKYNEMTIKGDVNGSIEFVNEYTDKELILYTDDGVITTTFKKGDNIVKS